MKTYEQILQEYLTDNYKSKAIPDYALFCKHLKDFKYKVRLSKKHWFWSYAVSKETSDEIIQEKYLYAQFKNDLSFVFKDIQEPVEKICRRFLEKPDSFVFTRVGTEVVYDFLDKDTGIIFTLKGRVTGKAYSTGAYEFKYEYDFNCSNTFEANHLETKILTLCLKELYESHFRKLDEEKRIKLFEKDQEERLANLKTARASMVNLYKNL